MILASCHLSSLGQPIRSPLATFEECQTSYFLLAYTLLLRFIEILLVTKNEVYSPLLPRGLCFFILFTKSVKSHHPRIKLAGVVERDLWEFHSGGLHKRCIKGFIEFISTPRSSSLHSFECQGMTIKKEVDPLCQYT